MLGFDSGPNSKPSALYEFEENFELEGNTFFTNFNENGFIKRLWQLNQWMIKVNIIWNEKLFELRKCVCLWKYILSINVK